MRQVPEPEHSEWVRRMRELARQDAEELVPRPPFAVLGLSAPLLRPAALTESQQVNGEWTSVTLAYGDWAAGPAGPYVAITSAAVDPDAPALAAQLPGTGGPGRGKGGPEAELLRALDTERNRLAVHAGVDEEPASPPRYSQVRLPAGEALLGRQGDVWAARLSGGTGVTVTITGRGVEPEAIRLEPAGDLRPYFEARNEVLGRLAAARRDRPPVTLPPAEGVAALRALADFTLRQHESILASVREGRAPRHRAGEAGMYGALWQRAVSEQQRIAGTGKPAADEVVTRVINHLGHLLEEAAWFTDPRLRDLAIDETLRHAMLGDDVPSKPAQLAWARYWDERNERNERWRRSPEPDILAGVQENEPIEAAWLDAWAAWAAAR